MIRTTTGLPRAAALVLTLAAAASWSPCAHAARYDLSLSNFATLDDSGLTLDAIGFKRMARDLGLALQPRFAGPATTVGGRGFDIGYAFSFTDIDQSASQWTTPVAGAGDLLQVSQIAVRKGLPYSFEIGAVVGYLHDSHLWGVAVELKWAFVEGYELAPDFGLRVHLNTMLGSRDIAMLSTGADLLIGKSFGLGGLVQLVPYAGYSFTYIRASSHVLGVFPEGGVQPVTFILPDQDVFAHRGVAGLRLVATIVDVGFEAALGEVHSFALRGGLNF